MSDSIQKIDKAMASINKGVDKKEEMKTMMAPYANWDRFLVPAPVSIALLGQLLLVSADTDFSLQDKTNPINFELLKYPDSFRACLVQVSNKGWGAFNLAHTCMDQIRLHSGNVDGHVRTAVKFLISGSAEEVALMLPNALKSIETIAEECVALSGSVQNEFVAVMQLVAELLEACTRARGQYEQNVKDTETAIEVANEYKKSIETQKAEAEKKQKEMMKQMKNAENDYKDALDTMPSTGDLIGLAVAGAVIDVARDFTGFLKMANPMMRAFPSDASTGKESASSTGKASASSPTSPDESVTVKIFKKVPQIKVQTDRLERLACGGKNKQGGIEPDWNKIGKGKGAQYVKKQLETIVEKKLPESELEIRENVKQLCIDGVEICETLLDLQKAINKDGEDSKYVVDRAQQLSSRVATMGVASRASLGGNSIPSNPPQLSKQVQANQESSGDDELVKSALQNARFKTETAKEMLKDSRNHYDKSCEDLAERMKQYGDILADLAKYDLQKIDFESIREVLINGIKALGELQEQWGKLVQFFQMLSNLVKCCFAQSLQTFVETSCNQKKLTEAGLAMSNTMRDVIFEQAFQANQIAFVVNSISSAYVEVSGAHLMDRVTCLGKLIGVDPANKHEIKQKREELNQGCKEAQMAIKRIAHEKKKEIDEAFDKRIGRIEREVEAVMPAMSQAEVKEIQDQVKTGMAMSKAAVEKELDGLC